LLFTKSKHDTRIKTIASYTYKCEYRQKLKLMCTLEEKWNSWHLVTFFPSIAKPQQQHNNLRLMSVHTALKRGWGGDTNLYTCICRYTHADTGQLLSRTFTKLHIIHLDSNNTKLCYQYIATYMCVRN